MTLYLKKVREFNSFILKNFKLSTEFLVESLVIYAGERFDFILQANQTIDLYWIRLRGLMTVMKDLKVLVKEGAVLQYFRASVVDYPNNSLDYSIHREGLVS